MIRTIIADPPWNEQGGGKVKRGADKHYPLMKTDAIIELMKHWYAEETHSEDQHLYLWTTNNFLVDALRVIAELGFVYKTNIVWVKQSFGLGRYFRQQHEIFLFATRGRGFAVRTEPNDISSVIHANKREHSRKPEEFYALVEKRSQGGYLEMFARCSRGPAYVPKGNQTDKFTRSRTAAEGGYPAPTYF